MYCIMLGPNYVSMLRTGASDDKVVNVVIPLAPWQATHAQTRVRADYENHWNYYDKLLWLFTAVLMRIPWWSTYEVFYDTIANHWWRRPGYIANVFHQRNLSNNYHIWLSTCDEICLCRLKISNAVCFAGWYLKILPMGKFVTALIYGAFCSFPR